MLYYFVVFNFFYIFNIYLCVLFSLHGCNEKKHCYYLSVNHHIPSAVVDRQSLDCTGLLGMVWLLFLRYYVVAQERRKAMVLSLKENMTMTMGAPSGPVPWLALFKQPAFWLGSCRVLSLLCSTSLLPV